MKFVKYQAIGNDFIIIENSEITSKNVEILCDRHMGIGADGVLINYRTEKADAGMKIINSDGSVAEMCGNGLRCFTAYLVNDCGFSKNPITVETGRGVLTVNWSRAADGSIDVEANLGIPEIISEFSEIAFLEEKLDTVAISMGNPHFVILPQKELAADKIYKTANYFQNNSSSGREMNVEVVTGINKKEKSVFIVVKERGAGYTLGCGTGGAAVIYALKVKGIISDEPWIVCFPGGEAEYRIEKTGEIIMKGTPEKVFSGNFESGLFDE